MGLAATSSDPSYATNNVETVVLQGKTVNLGGTGFDATNGVAVDLFCACTGGKVGPFFINPGATLTPSKISFTLPSVAPNVPSTGPGSFVVSNKGSPPSFTLKSNAVAVSIGQQIALTSVTQAGSIITVNGAGFSSLTVINLFNAQGGGVVNLGGLGPAGAEDPADPEQLEPVHLHGAGGSCAGSGIRASAQPTLRAVQQYGQLRSRLFHLEMTPSPA